jgi:hypothetical protein
MMLIEKGAVILAAPSLIIPMSPQPAIPQRVALQQSPPPLHRPTLNVAQIPKFLQWGSSTFYLRQRFAFQGSLLREATGKSIAPL